MGPQTRHVEATQEIESQMSSNADISARTTDRIPGAVRDASEHVRASRSGRDGRRQLVRLGSAGADRHAHRRPPRGSRATSSTE